MKAEGYAIRRPGTVAGRLATRRDFLGGACYGAAILTVPAFLAGCGVQQAIETGRPLPDEPFLQWFGIDPPALSRVFAVMTARGADFADIYLQHRRETVLKMDEGIVSRADTRIDQGAGLRVVAGDRSGFAFTENLTPEALRLAAREAAEALTGTALVSPPGNYETAPEGDLYRIAVPWSDIGADRKLPIVERLDRQARSADPAVDRVSISWSDVDERVTIASHDGRLVGDQRPMTRLSVQVTVTRGGRSEHGFANVSARDGIDFYTDSLVDQLAQEAVNRALVRFDAQSVTSGNMPVILAAGTSGILLHETIGHAFEADFVQDGVSQYSGSMHERIADASVTLVDQGTMPHERGALNYDDEGNACRRNVLVENGTLRSYLYDTRTARRAAVSTTASGRRESYRFEPIPRMTCTYLENGPRTREEIIASVDLGVIAETYTAGQVEPGRGEFSFRVATGWLVENGRITAPVSDFRVAGDGPETLRAITMVANDGRMDSGGWTCGKKRQRVPVSQGMPTVLVSSMAIVADTSRR